MGDDGRFCERCDCPEPLTADDGPPFVEAVDENGDPECYCADCWDRYYAAESERLSKP